MSENLLSPYSMPVNLVFERQKTTSEGLSSIEAELRLKSYGLNELEEKGRPSLIILLVRQFKNSIVYLLVAAVAISLFFQDYTEAIAIMAVIMINAIIGFILEASAVNSMEALKKMDKLEAVVLRDGQVTAIDARQLVPGDVIILEAGNSVPADARLMESSQLEVDESSLTGESVPVPKRLDSILEEETVLADRVNMVFKGTSISKGTARAIIISTGLNTEMGHISEMVEQARKDEIPLNKKLNEFSKKLIWLTVAIIIPFFIVGWLRSHEAHLMLETAIALAVAAIPEGLPIVATISLARGMLRLAKSNVIVKKLASVETLGETDVIITDKTGTLTENQLIVDKVELADGVHSESILYTVAVLCNNAVINESGEEIGDPVEIALLKYAFDHTNQQDLRSRWEKVDEKPFDSENRYMANLYQTDKGFMVSVKGSTAEVLELCEYIDNQNGGVSLNKASLEYWTERTHQLSAQGLKVLGFAYKEINQKTKNYAHGLKFLGLVGFIDPPRPGIKESISDCHAAGINVIMATGDHPETAKAIAYQIGLIDNPESVSVIHGKDFENKYSNTSEIPGNTQIFSRVTPEQKLRLISYFQANRHIVAMTGDGVNDAPALKKADIGIAMGQSGTQVAEEASDMVLQDDSFSSIITAIKQGRVIFRNIRNFIIYLLSCNLTEILVVAIAAFSNVTIPLLPLQILFLNLVTDVFPALALGMGEGNASIIKHKPRSPQDGVITTKNWVSIFVYAATLTFSILGLFYYSIYYLKLDEVASNNIAFYTLAFAQLLHPFNLIGRKDPLIKNDIVRNPHLWLAILLCSALLLMTYFVPFLKEILQISILGIDIWLYIAAASFAPLVIIRVLKWVGVMR
ncbi:MAG: cation-translocating P-type ATPase [Bacteroidota bacterium]